MLGDIDRSLEIYQPRLFLCKPNRTMIGELVEANKISLNIKLGQINTIKFTLPYTVVERFETVYNENILMIKEKYLIKLEYGNDHEWFIVNSPIDFSDDNGEYREITCNSLPYEIRYKDTLDYKKDVTLKEALENGLIESDWGVGFVDPDLNKTLSLDLKATTSLDFIFKVVEKAQGLIYFDSENKTIHIYKPDNFGTYKGLNFEYGGYLKSLTKEIKTDVVTRLRCFGKDDIDISSVMIHGQNYIEDFSYYMSTDYMSQGLLDALNAYYGQQEALMVQYESLKAELNNKNTLLKEKEAQLVEEKATLILKEKSLDSIIINGTARANAFMNVLVQKVIITALNNEITALNNDIATLNGQIDSIVNQLKLEANLTPEQMLELNKFIEYGTYKNDSITDPNELLIAGQRQFEKLKIPQLTLKINIVNFKDSIETQEDWDKLNIGDIVNIYHPKLNVDIKAKIVQIDYDFEAGSINLIISTLDEVKNNMDEWLKAINKSADTSRKMLEDRQKWNAATNVVSEVEQIIKNNLDAAKQNILAGTNNEVSVSHRGILVSDPTNTMNQVQINNGGIYLTNDEWNTIRTAITAMGITASEIFGELIAGQKLIIQGISDDGQLVHFQVDGQGVTLDGGYLNVIGSDNGVSLSSLDGLVITRADMKSRVILNATHGFSMQNNVGDAENPIWEENLYIDPLTGYAKFKGNIDTAQDAFVGNNLFIGEYLSNDAKAIYFNNSANIYGGTGEYWAGIDINAQRTWINGGDLHIATSFHAYGQPFVRAYVDQNFSLSNSGIWYTIPANVEENDISNNYDSSIYKFIAPEDGTYFISAGLVSSLNNQADIPAGVILAAFKNNSFLTKIAYGFTSHSDGSGNQTVGSTSIKLAQGDEIQIKAMVTKPSTMSNTVTNSGNNFVNFALLH